MSHVCPAAACFYGYLKNPVTVAVTGFFTGSNVREIAEGAIYVWNREKKHFLKKEIERCTVNEDFLRVGQYVYFYQGGNNGATSGPLMKASLSNPGGVQVVRLYDSLEEAGLA